MVPVADGAARLPLWPPQCPQSACAENSAPPVALLPCPQSLYHANEGEMRKDMAYTHAAAAAALGALCLWRGFEEESTTVKEV